MKEIKAIIQPFMADHVIGALREMRELPGMTVSQVMGFGRGRAVGSGGQAEESGIFGEKKVKLEMVVRDELVQKVIEVITRYAHTGNPGDGKIFITDVADAVQIRTGSRGDEVI